MLCYFENDVLGSDLLHQNIHYSATDHTIIFSVLSGKIPVIEDRRVVIIMDHFQGAIEAIACTIIGSAVSRALAAALKR